MSHPLFILWNMSSPAHPPEACMYPNHVTFATRWRAPHFLDKGLGLFCLEAMENERARMGIDVLAYALMPDHFHIVIGPTRVRTGYVVQALKLASVHQMMASGATGGGVWQRGYYDVGLRDTQQVRSAIDYVHRNPAVAELVADPASYELSSYAAWEGKCESIILLSRELVGF